MPLTPQCLHRRLDNPDIYINIPRHALSIRQGFLRTSRGEPHAETGSGSRDLDRSGINTTTIGHVHIFALCGRELKIKKKRTTP